MKIETEATLAVWTTKVHNTLLPLIQTKNQPDFASWIYHNCEESGHGPASFALYGLFSALLKANPPALYWCMSALALAGLDNISSTFWIQWEQRHGDQSSKN